MTARVLAAVAAAGLAAGLVAAAPAQAQPAPVAQAATTRAAQPVVAGGTEEGGTSMSRFDRPRSGFAPARTLLRNGSARSGGLDPAPIRAALDAVAGWTEGSGSTRPLYPGAVTVMAHDGVVVASEATGYAVRYADGAGTELPRDQWVPTAEDTVYDMASVSKLFTSIALMQQVEAGRVDLDAPVATYVPEFAENGKEQVTVRHLLTHTGGLPAWLPLWSAHPDPASRLQAVLTATPLSAPGEEYVYSDLGMITIGVVVERASGQTLDEVVREGLTEPLGMVDTGYNPTGSQLARAAATEYQTTPDRGMVRGSVHDENAWSLGGVAGHAGIFSTAADMSVLAQALLNGGTYAGARVLTEESVEAMLRNENAAYPGNDHGLGFELHQHWYMAGLAGPRTAGHTGYTGTSMVLDFTSRSFVLLLSNRVHPSRDWGSVNPARRAVAQAMALALGVEPREGRTAWATAALDATSQVLQVPVTLGERGGRLSFDLFVDTESFDVLHLESSSDAGATWSPVPFTTRDRGELVERDGFVAASGHRTWWQAHAHLSSPEGADGELLLRWRYTTDANSLGRGVLVDGVRVTAPRQGVVLDGERHPELFTATGWRPVKR